MKPYTDLMIDLETLDTKTSAVILQIGWCFFDRNNPARKKFTRGWFPNTQEQIDMGFTVSSNTMNWWIQNMDMYKIQLEAQRLDLHTVVDQMHNIYGGAASYSTQVWAKGTTFDIPILSKIFEPPWQYRHIQDLRTLKLITPHKFDKENHQLHEAVADATHQAEEVQFLCSMINGD